MAEKLLNYIAVMKYIRKKEEVFTFPYIDIQPLICFLYIHVGLAMSILIKNK